MTAKNTRRSNECLWGVVLCLFVPLAAPHSVVAEDTSCAVCSCNGDRDGDGVVTVDEAVAAVNNLLDGCPQLRWQPGCGPIIPGSDECPQSVTFCTTEQVGAPCDEAPALCCLPGSKCGGQWCNAPLFCASHPPTACPISRRAYKRDIRYLGAGDVDELRHQLLHFRLARYRYTGESGSGPERLGFIIDDIEPSPAVDRQGNAVDLYGYLSMAVATIQAQAKDIEALKREVADMRASLNELHTAGPAKKMPSRVATIQGR